MSLYDIVMLVVFGGAIWFGWWKGLAWQIASVAAIVVSYFVSYRFRDQLAAYISAEEPWNRIAAMLILFLGSSLIIWTIYASVSKSLKKMELKGFDRQAGALLGAIKGALLCMIITMFAVSLMGAKAHDAIHNSKSGYYVVRGISQVAAIVPNELKPYVIPHVEKFNQQIGNGGNLPQNQFPQYQAYPTTEQGSQQVNQLPSFTGGWQLPTTSGANQNWGNNTGYSNQPTVPTNNGNNGGGWNWNWNNTHAPNNQNGSNQSANGNFPSGYQQPQQPAGGYSQNGNVYSQNGNANSNQTNNGTFTPNANGWPDVNFKVNSKDLLDRAAKAAADAARQAFENQQQWP